ncbi:hypothetical protein RUMGNA_02988 [Mediterraneibacter gnavus ATCC 29149]|uniref:Uncharacterized protein n=1 Tax=Mediterraneibacter gnavus (strain ATCC 29149 / DSM 114966 / JCM 6515 / VPI C7-9) TaxID=411470 RepID=A7B5Y5_MEDG7|nr:hypothetical protein RUMGNA_02988 [Mediterraneibacter gnavus ATCC 29149]
MQNKLSLLYKRSFLINKNIAKLFITTILRYHLLS